MATSVLPFGTDMLILCSTLQNIQHKKDADLEVYRAGIKCVWRRGGLHKLCISSILAATLKGKLRPGLAC